MLENRLLRGIFGLKRDNLMEVEEDCIIKSSLLVLFAKWGHAVA
jgi:hypothetical protein